MSATAETLHSLHVLHQRAKALRDRLSSGPRMLVARQNALATRQVDLEKARKSLQDMKVQLKKNEHTLQSHQSKIDDLKVKLNQVKKNEEYKALQNQIAHDQAAMGKVEEDILQAYDQIEAQTIVVAQVEAEFKSSSEDVATLKRELDGQTAGHQAQLAKIEGEIIEAETSIPEDDRDRYRRTVRQFGADALAAVEGNACLGCFTAVTTQMLNELINGSHLTFCKSCGRLLYLAEDEHSAARSGKR